MPSATAQPDRCSHFADYTERLTRVLAERRYGDAVALFMSNVGIPGQAIEAIRSGPGWSTLEAIAPTLACDDALLAGGRVPTQLNEALKLAILVLSGDASPHVLQQAAQVTAAKLPGAEHRVLAGQTHDVAAEVLAPVLVEFFGGPRGGDQGVLSPRRPAVAPYRRADRPA